MANELRSRRRWRPTHRTAVQIPRALLVSVVAAVIDVGCMVVMVDGWHWSVVLAGTLSYLLGGVVQYLACAWWIFPHAPANAVLGFGLFTILSLGGLAITDFVLWLANGVLGWYYVLAKFVALGLAFGWNFISRKYWIFRGQEGR